jgi:O-methyltransferase
MNDVSLANRYLRLLKRSLVNDLYIENEARIVHMVAAAVDGRSLDLSIVADIRKDATLFTAIDQAKDIGATVLISRSTGGAQEPMPYLRKVTDVSHTMIGRRRLDNLEDCLERIVANDVPGDLIETGVWRGGAVIFMRGFLAAHGIADRIVWAADSFAGLPPPSLPQDAGYDGSLKAAPGLAISLEAVKGLFERYGLLDDQVRFLKGWFKDTLPGAPIERLALLRLDGDLYESTMDALIALYGKVSAGGFVIVDDYYSCPPCRAAVEDFRRAHRIDDNMIQIDEQSLFWRKT